MFKKAQVSIEILAILGVIVLGSIIAGVYYINSINENITQSNNLSDLTSSFDDAFTDLEEPDLGTGGSGGSGVNGLCGDGSCVFPETYSSCPGDCYASFVNLNGVISDTNAEINVPFNIQLNAKADFASSSDVVSISSVSIKKWNGINYSSTDNCNIVGQPPASNYTNIGYIDDDFVPGDGFYNKIVSFECAQEGDYRFSLEGTFDVNSYSAQNLATSLNYFDKTVVTNIPLSVNILSPSENQVFEVNDNLFLNAEVIGSDFENVSCKWYAKQYSNTAGSTPAELEGVVADDTLYFATVNVTPNVIFDTNETDGWHEIYTGGCNPNFSSFVNMDLFGTSYGTYELKVYAFDTVNYEQFTSDKINFIYKDPASDWVVSYDPSTQITGDFALMDVYYVGDSDYSNISFDVIAPSNLSVTPVTPLPGQDPYVAFEELIGGGVSLIEIEDDDILYFAGVPGNMVVGDYNLDYKGHRYFALQSSVTGVNNITLHTIDFEKPLILDFNTSFEFVDMTPLDVNLSIVVDNGTNPNGGNIYLSLIKDDSIFYFEGENTVDKSMQVYMNDPISFIPIINGGSFDYTCNWELDGQPLNWGCEGPYVYTFTQIGTKLLELSVVDNHPLGESAIINVTFDIQEPPFNVNITNPTSTGVYNINVPINCTYTVTELPLGTYSCKWYKNNILYSTDCDTNIVPSTYGIDIPVKLYITSNDTNETRSNTEHYSVGSSNYDSVNISSTNKYRFGQDIYFSLEGNLKYGGSTQAINSGCTWKFNNTIIENNDCSFTKSFSDLNLNEINNVYNVEVEFVDNNIFTFNDSQTYYIGECISGDTSCEFNGKCIPDNNITELGTCEWVVPNTFEFITIHDIGNNYINFDRTIPFNSTFGNNGVSFDCNINGASSSMLGSCGFIGGFQEDVNGFSDLAKSTVFANVESSPDYTLGESYRDHTLTSNFSVHSGIVSISDPLKEYVSPSNYVPVGKSIGPFMTYLRNDESDDMDLISIFDIGPAFDEMSGVLSPESEICVDCGTYSPVGNNCKLISAGAGVINSDTDQTNKLFVPVYFHCSNYRTVGMFTSKVNSYVGISSGSPLDWDFLDLEGLDNGNYSYDYPSFAVKDDTLILMGVRYPENNVNVIEWYVYYSVDQGATWTIKSTSFESNNSYLGPIFSRGNSLVIDSDNVAHYAFGGSPLYYLDSYEVFGVSSLFGSTPSEMLFDLDTNHFEYRPVFPNPGFNGSQLGVDLRTVSFESLVPNLGYVSDSYQGYYSVYEQQAVNLDENWMIQTWLSWDLDDDVLNENLNGYVTVASGYRSLKMAFSNDNGIHWTPPVVIMTNNDSSSFQYVDFSISEGKDFKYFTLSKDIVKLDSNRGIVNLMYSVGEEGSDLENRYSLSVEINFGVLDTITDKSSVMDFINNYSGNTYYTQPSSFFDWLLYNDLDSHCTIFDTSSVEDPEDCLLNWQGGIVVPRPENKNMDDVFAPINSGSNTSGGTAGFTCFKKGTLINTPEGLESIETLKSGDIVYSLDPESNTLVETNIKSLLVHREPAIVPSVKVTLNNGSVIYTTKNHAFYNPVLGTYMPLGDFKVGNALYVYDFKNNSFEFNVINSIDVVKDYIVSYNLALDTPNNYLVDGVVVHNELKTLPNMPGNHQICNWTWDPLCQLQVWTCINI